MMVSKEGSWSSHLTNVCATDRAWLDFQTFGFCPSKPPGPSPVGRFTLRRRFRTALVLAPATVYVGIYINIYTSCMYMYERYIIYVYIYIYIYTYTHTYASCICVLCIHLCTYLSFIYVYIYIYIYRYIVRTSWWFPRVWKIWVLFPKPRKRIFNPPPQCLGT